MMNGVISELNRLHHYIDMFHIDSMKDCITLDLRQDARLWTGFNWPRKVFSGGIL